MSRKPTHVLKIENEHKQKKIKNDTNFLNLVVKADSELVLGSDTYTMAFKAFNYEFMRDLKLDQADVHGAF